MKIKAIHVRDFKGIKDIQLDSLDPTLVVITGRNAQGKSSLLDAIVSGLSGKAGTPDVPIRKGADKAEIIIDLGEIQVKKRITRDGKTYLTVENRDGTTRKSPQAVLDTLYNRATFDPVAFTGMAPKEQSKILRTLAGLDKPLADLDAKSKTLFDERTDVNRRMRDLEGTIKTYPMPVELAGVPDQETSAADAMAEYQQAMAKINKNETVRQSCENAKLVETTARARYVEAVNEVARLTAALETAEAIVERRSGEASEALAVLNARCAEARRLVDPDIDLIRSNISNVETVNRNVRVKLTREKCVHDWTSVKAESERLTDHLAMLTNERSALLSEAVYPIDGFDVRDDDVLYCGVPLCQASSRQKILVGLAVGAALNPGIEIALVRTGSMLDEEGKSAAFEWAKDSGNQLWLELVGSKDSEEGIIIEEGMLLADRPLKYSEAAEARESNRPQEDRVSDSKQQAETLF